MTLREAVLCATVDTARSPAPLVVAVAGALGKRSTAALLTRLLGSPEPAVPVGPSAPAGADRPRVAVVLNVGCSQGGSKQRTATALGELLAALPPDGLAVLNADDPYTRSLAACSNAPVLTFGRTNGDVRAVSVTLDAAGRAGFTLTDRRGAGAPVRLGRPGAHQVFNATAAAAVALELGFGLDRVAGDLGRSA
jgi:UDP-N-acetylmuramyl pentapeptide synthase